MRSYGSLRQLAVLFGVLLAFSLAPAYAGPKEDALANLLSLGEQFQNEKSTGRADSPGAQGLLQSYQAISDQLGGDDPVGILARSGHRVATRSAPLPPPPLPSADLSSFSNNTVTAIPDGPGGNASSEILVSTPNSYLWDLDMTTAITHTFAADLEITLTSPAGTMVVITTDNGGGNDDVFNGTLWDDSAGTPVTDAIFANGVAATPLVPEEAMGAFIGENPNGTWTLSITDDAGLDIGNLNSWSLDVQTCTGIIPANPVPVLNFYWLLLLAAVVVLAVGGYLRFAPAGASGSNR